MSNQMNRLARVAPTLALALLAATLVVASAAATGPIARFKTPSGPGFLAIDHGAVWVAAHRGGALYKLNPRTNRIARTIQTHDDVFDLAVMGRYLVLSEGPFPGLRLIDPRTGKTVRYVKNGLLPVRWGASAWRLTLTGLARLDPKTHVVLKRFRVRGAEGPVVHAAGSLWVPCDAWVTRIVLATNKETVIPLPGGRTKAGPDQGYAVASHLAATPGKIWIGNPAGIYWVDEATNKATVVPGTVIGNLDEWGNIGIYAAAGSVFARTGPSTVSRIDPTTGAVVAHYHATGGGGDVAYGFGSLWVTNFGTDSTWRETL
jgi:hypothetical protein